MIELRKALRGRSLAERTALFDHPGFRVAEEIGRAVPAAGCVLILAYSGPSAVDYYRARMAYYLYPRQVSVADCVSIQVEDCQYLAVFRDSPQNLAVAPFQGTWDTVQLERRLSSLDPVSQGKFAAVFRTP